MSNNDARLNAPKGLVADLWAILALIIFTLPAHLKPANFLPDDTYHYLQVAYNIVEGHGSTFNQIVPTNGYHPLWMLFCTLVTFLTGGSKPVAMHVILAVQAFLYFPIIALFTAITERTQVRYGMLGYPILALYFLTGLFGSEAHLNALASLIALYYLLHAIGDDLTAGARTRSWILTGLFLGLSLLARLDNLFLASTLILFGVIARPRELRAGSVAGGIARELLLVAIPAAVVVAPYLIWNQVNFGHLMPVSGAIKSSFPAITFDVDRLALLGKIVTLFAVVGVLLSFRSGSTPMQRMMLRLLGAAVLLQSIYVVFYLEFGAGWSWYYVIGVLNLTYVVSILAGMIIEPPPGRSFRVSEGVMVLLAGAIFIVGVARSWYKFFDPYFTHKDSFFQSVESGGSNPRPVLGAWLKSNLPPGSGLLVEDGAGAIAYYSDLRVLTLDGLIADYSYNDDLLRLGAPRYLEEKRVDYYVGMVDPRARDSQSVRIVAPLYRRVAGTLTLHRADLLHTIRDNPRPFDVGVWRIRR